MGILEVLNRKIKRLFLGTQRNPFADNAEFQRLKQTIKDYDLMADTTVHVWVEKAEKTVKRPKNNIIKARKKA
jgi:hypothetical protein